MHPKEAARHYLQAVDETERPLVMPSDYYGGLAVAGVCLFRSIDRAVKGLRLEATIAEHPGCLPDELRDEIPAPRQKAEILLGVHQFLYYGD